MSLVSAADLLAAASRLRLLDAAQQIEAGSLSGTFPQAKALARELIRRGWLTAYQVNQLFLDRGDDLVLGPYVLLDRLGEGGMGAVYRARNWKLGKVVALKVIRKDRSLDPEASRRFLREIQAAARLDHPNIVRADDADEIGSTLLLAMEYQPGSDLSRLLQQQGPFDVLQACDYVRQAALALQHAHEHGMVHRDIKPSNLFLTRDDSTIKLLDMGLARLPRSEDGTLVSSPTAEGLLMGTPDYLAPEQAEDAHSVDIRADLYSLGCTFYHLLTGQVPFPGGVMLSKLVKHRLSQPVPIAALRPEVPAEVSAIVETLMAKAPQDRFQSPLALVQALDAVRATLASRASPVRQRDESSPFVGFQGLDPGQTTLLGRLGTSVLDRRRLIGVASGVALVSLAGLGAMGVLRRRPGEKPVSSANGTGGPLVEVQPSSPLDLLDPARIPANQRFSFQPGELVAVLGDHRGRHFGRVTGIVFHPGDRFLASSGSDDVVRFWDPGTLIQQTVFPAGRIAPGSFSPDGRFLAAAGRNPVEVQLWEVTAKSASERTSLRGHEHPVELAVFSRDGKWLASSDQRGRVLLWERGTEGPPTLKALLAGHPNCVHLLAFAPDSRTLASGGHDGVVRLWDLTAPEPREKARLTGKPFAIPGLAFFPDGKSLVVGGYQSFRFWNLSATPIPDRAEFVSIGVPIRTLALRPDGNLLIAPCGTADSRISLWTRDEGKWRSEASVHPGVIGGGSSAAHTSDGATLAYTTNYGEIRICDGKDLRLREKVSRSGHLPGGCALAFTSDGVVLVSAACDRSIRLWRLTGAVPEEEAILEDNLTVGYSLALSPDDRTIATVDPGSGVRLIDLEKRTTPTGGRTPDVGDVRSFAFSADGKTLVGCPTFALALWHVEGSKLRLLSKIAWPTERGRLTAVVFLPGEDRFLTAGVDGRVRFWDVRSGKFTECQSFVEPSSVHALALSPTGKILATGCKDGKIRFHDPQAIRQEPTILAGPSGPICSLAYAPRGRLLASASDTGQVIVWDLARGTRYRSWQMPGANPAIRVLFAPDGRHLAIANSNGTIYLVRLKLPT